VKLSLLDWSVIAAYFLFNLGIGIYYAQLVTLLLMIVSLVVTFYLESIGAAWKLLLVTGAGTGTALLLRWFWWRINAWSEVSAMIAAAACSLFLQLYLKWDSERPKNFAYLMLVTVAVTTVVWLLTTFLTSAEPVEKLIFFYRKVRPEGPGWNRIAQQAGLSPANASGGLAVQFVNWFLGCFLIYAFLFGIGYVIFGEMLKGVCFLLAGAIASAAILRNLQRTVWQPIPDETPRVGEAIVAKAVES
jgi:solute:Na+ symporter, SSS family